MTDEQGSKQAERDEKLRQIRKKFGIGGIAWLQYKESYEAAFEAGRASLEEENRKLRERLKDLIDCWDVFYKFLPDGEYRGLGQLRPAFNQHRAALAGKSWEVGKQ